MNDSAVYLTVRRNWLADQSYGLKRLSALPSNIITLEIYRLNLTLDFRKGSLNPLTPRSDGQFSPPATTYFLLN